MKKVTELKASTNRFNKYLLNDYFVPGFKELMRVCVCVGKHQVMMRTVKKNQVTGTVEEDALLCWIDKENLCALIYTHCT